MQEVGENRKWPRSKINWPVTVKSDQITIKGETRDISQGGVFMYCEKPITPNQLFYISIHLHSEVVTFTIMAESVWSTINGIGAKFHLERSEQGQLLSEFISEL